MRIRWTIPAAEDLENVKNYLKQHYPHFAEPTVRIIYQRIRSLKTSPYLGRPVMARGFVARTLVSAHFDRLRNQASTRVSRRQTGGLRHGGQSSEVNVSCIVRNRFLLTPRALA